jgi:NAD(P)-dependent dehydrogenase (short-subunit alcohol dehydrogenase family)
MKVLVTGGTGFVGSHSVKAIVDAGHDLRLLVRSPGRPAPALEPLGVRGVEHVVGDATDADSVRRAMDGCDAVVHDAAIFSYDARAARDMRRVNARATEVVLGAARDAGRNPIMHVSTYVALLPPGGVLDGDSPVGDPRGAYARSKAETEQMARQLQEHGAPVVITYPGMVWDRTTRTWVRRRPSRARSCGAWCRSFRPRPAAHRGRARRGRSTRRHPDRRSSPTALHARGRHSHPRRADRSDAAGHRPAPCQGHGTGTARAGHDRSRRRRSARAPVPPALQLRRRVGRHARRSDRRIGDGAGPRCALPTAGGLDRGHASLAASGRPFDRSAGRPRRGARSVTDSGCPLARSTALFELPTL